MPQNVLSAETQAMLDRYVKGRVSNAELEEWLVQVGYDAEVARPEKEGLAQVRLVLVEKSEGLRTPDDVLQAVAQLLASAEPGKQVLAFRTSSGTQWSGGTFITSTSRQLRVDISA